MTKQNPVSRTIDPASPIWIPFAFNIGLLLLAFGYRVYNYKDSPSVTQLTRSNTNVSNSGSVGSVGSVVSVVTNQRASVVP
jgi:hypothetical protein